MMVDVLNIRPVDVLGISHGRRRLSLQNKLHQNALLRTPAMYLHSSLMASPVFDGKGTGLIGPSMAHGHCLSDSWRGLGTINLH